MLKKCFKMILGAFMAFSMVACSSQPEKEAVSILCPSGAPALAMLGAGLVENVTIDYANTDVLQAELSKEDGEYENGCVSGAGKPVSADQGLPAAQWGGHRCGRPDDDRSQPQPAPAHRRGAAPVWPGWHQCGAGRSGADSADAQMRCRFCPPQGCVPGFL